MKVQCPQCETLYDVTAENIGQRVECQCGTTFEAIPMRTVSEPQTAQTPILPPAFGAYSGSAMKSLLVGKEPKRYRASVLAVALDIIGTLVFIGGCALAVTSSLSSGTDAIIGGLLIAAAGSVLRLLTQISDQLAGK